MKRPPFLPTHVNAIVQNERGVALLLAVFIITLGTILVFEMGKISRVDTKSARIFAERIQGDYVLKSGVNLSRVLLEIPKLPGQREDWLGEPWSLISSAPTLPIGGVVGDPRLLIVDEFGKIDINVLENRTGQGGAPQFWVEKLINLFTILGFGREVYERNLNRTLGNTSFEPQTQVAAIIDWIDRDTNSFQAAGVDAQGIESDAPKEFFYNRRLANISELLLIPGITKERLGRLASLIRISPRRGQSVSAININTAPYEVLLAMGIPNDQAIQLMQNRLGAPIKAADLTSLLSFDPTLKSYFGVTSSEFSAVVRIVMPNSTRWARVVIGASGLGANRQTTVRSQEFH